MLVQQSQRQQWPHASSTEANGERSGSSSSTLNTFVPPEDYHDGYHYDHNDDDRYMDHNDDDTMDDDVDRSYANFRDGIDSDDVAYPSEREFIPSYTLDDLDGEDYDEFGVCLQPREPQPALRHGVVRHHRRTQFTWDELSHGCGGVLKRSRARVASTSSQHPVVHPANSSSSSHGECTSLSASRQGAVHQPNPLNTSASTLPRQCGDHNTIAPMGRSRNARRRRAAEAARKRVPGYS